MLRHRCCNSIRQYPELGITLIFMWRDLLYLSCHALVCVPQISTEEALEVIPQTREGEIQLNHNVWYIECSCVHRTTYSTNRCSIKVLAPAKFGIFSLFLIILIPCVKNVFAGVLTLWHSLRIELIFFTTFMGHTPHMRELSIQTPGVSKSHFHVLLCGLCDMSDETFGDCVKGISKIFCGWQCNLSPYFRKYWVRRKNINRKFANAIRPTANHTIVRRGFLWLLWKFWVDLFIRTREKPVFVIMPEVWNKESIDSAEILRQFRVLLQLSAILLGKPLIKIIEVSD